MISARVGCGMGRGPGQAGCKPHLVRQALPFQLQRERVNRRTPRVGDILTVKTTHIKQGFVRRNGLVQSDLATMVEHFIRHGNILTHVSVVTDPVYTTEPLIKSEDFQLDELATLAPLRQALSYSRLSWRPRLWFLSQGVHVPPAPASKADLCKSA